jgi:gliding motility-associated-like protein
MANQTICYTNTNQTVAVTGISAGPESAQTTTLAVSSDNPGLFDQLTIVANGADKATITYHLKNNTSAVANITVTVTDNGGTDFGGVNTTSKSFKLTVNALPTINISSNNGLSVSKGEALILTASGGTQYSWTGNDITNGQNTTAITIRPKQSGIYKVTVTNANGCTTDQSINITVVDDYKLEAGTVITPNGDGINDKFIIKNLDYYPNNTLKIFDKAGRVLYTKQSYSNDWDGMISGSPLSEGTYYYILDMGTGIGTFKGYINIIRD